MGLAGPRPLDASDDLSRFDCGVPSIDTWLKRHARVGAAAGSARTYVVTHVDRPGVIGYHALTAASVELADATPRLGKGMPRHPIPAGLLARLAVDRSVRGRGIGAWLLRDAMLRALSAAETVGIRAMLVHAIDEAARRFYLRHGFEPSPTDDRNLQIMLKDVRASLNVADHRR